jgi:hypothetical protein
MVSICANGKDSKSYAAPAATPGSAGVVKMGESPTSHDGIVLDAAIYESDVLFFNCMLDVLQLAGGKVVEDDHLVAV